MSVDTKVTVVGWVGTQPRLHVSESGTSFTSFRLGSTRRYFDRGQDRWVDGATTWYTVKAWRNTAVNVAESLRRSDPVVVHGTLTSEVWDSPEGARPSFVVEADALGPDLTRGQATFRHTVHRPGGADPGAEDLPTVAAEAAPEDDPWAVDGVSEDDGPGAAADDGDLREDEPDDDEEPVAAVAA